MSVDDQGNLTHGVTLHDVLRNLVRGRWPNTELNQRAALLAIDAHEQGFPDSAAWEAELRRRAEMLAPVAPVSDQETPEQATARLEAENARLQALLRAQTGGAVSVQPARPGAPKEGSDPSPTSAP